MAETANIVVNDGASTPVSRTFEPSLRNGLLVRYTNDNGGIAALDPTITVSMRQPANGSNRRVTLKVEVPEEVTVGDANIIEFVTISMDVIVPPHVADLTIDHALAFVTGCLAETQITDAVGGKFPY